MAVHGSMGAVYAKTGPSVAFSNVTMNNIGGDRMTYEISDTAKRYWDTSQPVTVQTSPDGSTWTTVTSGYTIEYPGGRVVFSSPLASGTQVRVSASAYSVASIAGFFNWELELKIDTENTPTFGSTWNQVTPTLKGFSAKASWYWASNTFMTYLGDNEMIFVFYVDTVSKRRYEGYGTITSAAPSVPADGVVQEKLEFSGKGRVYYREG